jgi:hypothetical protein
LILVRVVAYPSAQMLRRKAILLLAEMELMTKTLMALVIQAARARRL